MFLALLDSHWYIGFPEKRLRSKASDLSLVPLIDWEYLQDDGEWRDLKEVNTNQNILHTFTLSLTIKHGQKKYFKLNKNANLLDRFPGRQSSTDQNYEDDRDPTDENVR